MSGSHGHTRLIFSLLRKGCRTVDELVEHSKQRRGSVFNALCRLRELNMIIFDTNSATYTPIVTDLMRSVYEGQEERARIRAEQREARLRGR